MSVSFNDQKEKLEKRLREIYKMGMPRAIEAQKVVEARKNFFFESSDAYMRNKIEIFVKNVEYLKNVTMLMENSPVIKQINQGSLQDYQNYRYQIDRYIFFRMIREIPYITEFMVFRPKQVFSFFFS